MGSAMSARHFRFLGLAAYLLLIYVLEFQLPFKLLHVLISGPPRLLAILALAFLFIFVGGRKAQILKAVTLRFIPLRRISFHGHLRPRCIKLHEEPARPFDDPTVLPLFQRPPP